jgi:AcrR family transcriptional regulator
VHNETGVPMRRRPRQARGQERVALILDAAEQLFAEQGYEASSTNAIAARAGVPIGSIYQFFPNKEALLHALVARYRAGAAASFDAALGPEAADLPLATLIARLLDVMVAFGAEQIGFTRLVLHSGGHPQLQAAAAALQADVAARAEGLLALRAPQLAPARRQLVARVALTAVFALLSLVVAEKPFGPAHAEALIAETRRLLVTYLVAASAEAQPFSSSEML